jgi:hypothetical protein
VGQPSVCTHNSNKPTVSNCQWLELLSHRLMSSSSWTTLQA